jgi:hypothetical protein
MMSLAALLGLAACSLIGKGGSSLDGRDRPGALDSVGDAADRGSSPVADVPKLEGDEDDPPHVVEGLDRLNNLEKYIGERAWDRYARESRDLNDTLLRKDGWKGEKKRGAMKKRLLALDAAAFKTFGGRLHRTVGTGARITTDVDADGMEAAAMALTKCEEAAKTTTTGRGDAKDTLEANIAAYEKAIARARKVDKKAFRYYAEHDGWTIDVPTKMLECEVKLVALADQYGDEYEPEVAAETGEEKGCGSMNWLASGVQIRAGRFAPYSRTEGGANLPEKMSCKKLKKKSKFPRALAAAVAEFKRYHQIPDAVVTTEGRPYIEEKDDDLRLYRYQALVAYSRKLTFAANPCGGGEKLFCEAGGSKGAREYNELEHHLDRAQVHAGRAPDRCKKHLESAVKNWEAFQELYKELNRSKQWVSDSTYKTKKGAKLKAKAFIATFEKKATLADERLLEKYCKRAQSDDGEKTAAADAADDEGE